MTIRPSRLFCLVAPVLMGTWMTNAETKESRVAETSAGELAARVPAPAASAGPAPTGIRPLRDQGALLYVPAGYRPERPAPLLVLFHGAGGNAGHSIALARRHSDRNGFLVLAPKSRAASWDVISRRSYGADVGALDSALREVFGTYRIDPDRIAVGGFSDGASYALSLGLINGELFRHVFAFAPGFMAPERLHGKPRIFVSHGKADRVLPIDSTSRRIVPLLKQAGYEVDYEEFAGGHEVPDRIARRFLERLAGAR